MLDRLLLPWRKPTEAKAATGVGAFWMTNEPHVSVFAKPPEEKARKAQEIGTSHRWIRAAERVISTSVGTVPWHLETEHEEAVGDKSSEQLRALQKVLEKPYTPLPGEPLRPFPRTRSGLWGITSRHMGLCGYAFWYVDGADLLGIPAQLLYINPARLTPAGEKGNIMGWVLDKDQRGNGVPLEAGRVLMFTLEEADEGWFPAGLVETAMSLAQITRSADRHAASTIASGGKRPGVFAPAAAAGVMPPDVFAQLEKELRGGREDPDSHRRDLILKGPIEFTDRAANNEQLDLVALMNLSRDDTLELWGVPRSQLGGSTPTGLNSGEKGNYDEAAFWQKGVHPRLVRMYETIQFQLLDMIAPNLGQKVELVLEEPTFDDDAPKYSLAQTAQGQPLRNVERRALLGLDPFGDPLLDNAVWMPMGIVPLAEAPLEAKAKLNLDSLRPKLTQALAGFLAEQKREIVSRVRKNAAHLTRPGGSVNDTDAWWNGAKWDAALRKLLAPYAQSAADLAVKHAQAQFSGKALAQDVLGNPVMTRLLATLGKRITGINETTRQHVLGAIHAGIDAGDSPGAIGDRIEDLPEGVFGEYRGELIARTETAQIMNTAALESYREFGVQMVRAIDGDADEECAARDGKEFELDEALSITDHPNGTLDWVPIVGKAVAGTLPALPDPAFAEIKAQIASLIAAIEAKEVERKAMVAPEGFTMPSISIPLNVERPNIYVQPAEQPAPIVNVTNPAVTVNVPDYPTPIVNVDVAAPIVNIEAPAEGKADTVQDVRVVEMPVRRVTASKKVKRNNLNLITEVTETSVEE